MGYLSRICSTPRLGRASQPLQIHGKAGKAPQRDVRNPILLTETEQFGADDLPGPVFLMGHFESTGLAIDAGLALCRDKMQC